MSRFVITNEVRKNLEVKKSDFITWLKAIDSREQAMAYLQEARDAYPDARHHCWAYVMGGSPNSQTAAMSDDGEPSGTAGKPMLNVLQHKPVNNVMAIVIRYFGGIKLGAGGLVRAYSQAVEQAFSEAALEVVVLKQQHQLTLDFALEQWVRHLLGLHQGQVVNLDYSNSVTMLVELPQSESAAFIAQLQSKNIEITED